MLGKGITMDAGTGCHIKKVAYNHSAISPEKLAEDHILSWSHAGEIVLDPFMGSGTTAKMAKKNNRYYIGFEVSQEYVNLTYERLLLSEGL
jgi:site-specific DNA-methyltransferase (adenine-specific)